MKSLTQSHVFHLAKLANIPLTKKEVDMILPQLSEVIGYFEQLSSVNTDGIPPTSQTTGLLDVLREDTVNAARVLPQNKATSGTEKVKNGAFLVPQVIDKDI